MRKYKCLMALLVLLQHQQASMPLAFSMTNDHHHRFGSLLASHRSLPRSSTGWHCLRRTSRTSSSSRGISSNRKSNNLICVSSSNSADGLNGAAVPDQSLLTDHESLNLSLDDGGNESTSNNNAVLSSGGVVPSYRKMLTFVSTTILIWLSEPLLSLVDTTVVGRSSVPNAVVQIAAMGPATMLIDSGIYLVYFLAIATTNIMAKALAKRDVRGLQQTSSHVMGVATALGVVLMSIVFLLGKPMLHWMAGSTTSRSPELIQFALTYAKIRSMVAPLAVLGFVTQSICLACLDTTTPMLAVAVASLVNIVGDVWLVSKCNMGIKGAAIATAVATMSSTFILLREVKNKTKLWRRQQQQQQQEAAAEAATTLPIITDNETTVASDTTSSDTTSNVSDASVNENDETEQASVEKVAANDNQDVLNITVDGTKETTKKVVISVDASGVTEIIDHAERKEQHHATTNVVSAVNETTDHIPFMSLPDRKSFISLVKLAGPIFFVLVGKIVCYSSMTLRATDFGVLALATHGVMMRVFFFYTCFGDSVSQAAQSFVPQVLFHKDAPSPSTSGVDSLNKDKKNLRKLLFRLGLVSSYIAVVNSQIAGWILRNCGSHFTNDPSMIQMMAKHAKFMTWALMLHPFIMLFEGSLIVTRDLTYLVANYFVTIGLLMAQLKFACHSFDGVWRALFVFQVIRLVQFSTRFFNRTLRKESKAVE